MKNMTANSDTPIAAADLYLRRVLLDELVDCRGDDVVAVGQAEHERGRERAEHFGENEDGRAENAGHDQRQGDAQHGAKSARPNDLRCLL